MLISAVPASPLAPVQPARPSPAPVQGVAAVEAIAPAEGESQRRAEDLSAALRSMDGLREALAMQAARVQAATASAAQQARAVIPTPIGRSESASSAALGHRLYAMQSALTETAQARRSGQRLSLEA
jgi:hypothetical protein